MNNQLFVMYGRMSDMNKTEIVMGLLHAKNRFKCDEHVYEGFFFQQEWDAFCEAIKYLQKELKDGECDE